MTVTVEALRRAVEALVVDYQREGETACAATLHRLLQPTHLTRLAEKLSAPPVGTDWTDWTGGIQPVALTTRVDVKHRNGMLNRNWPAHTLEWAIQNQPIDIVQWRLAR